MRTAEEVASRIAPSWQRKHQAIASAALRLFARDGYERTSVDAIAAEAGVSKRTIYSHYGDKQNLFLLVVRDTHAEMRDRFREIMDRTLRDVDDLEKSLTGFVSEIARTLVCVPERATLMRLVLTEIPHFPPLMDMWRDRAVVTVLAEPLARLAAVGKIAAPDPTLAAEHFAALTLGQLNTRSLMGTIQLSDAEVDHIITNGIRVFLRAYGPAAQLGSA